MCLRVHFIIRAVAWAGDSWMTSDPASPSFLDAHADSDAWSPGHRADGDAAVFNDQPPRHQVELIFCECDPERTRQVAGSATQVRIRHVSAGRCTSLLHQAESVHGFERANQHGGWPARRFGYGIDEIVNAVIQVHVRKARSPIQRCIPIRRTWRRMTGRVVLANVRLCFHDHSGRHTAGGTMHEHLT